MGATIETISVSQNPETVTLEEVTCMYCGLPTPVPASGISKIASHFPRHISIVRCEVCGKEAAYRTCELLELGEVCRARRSQ